MKWYFSMCGEMCDLSMQAVKCVVFRALSQILMVVEKINIQGATMPLI